jgi:hypothetical protein
VFDFFAFVAVSGYVVIFIGLIFVLFFSASLCVLLSTVLCISYYLETGNGTSGRQSQTTSVPRTIV